MSLVLFHPLALPSVLGTRLETLDKSINGMIDTESKPDRSLAVVVGVDIFNVVDDGIEKVRLSDCASRDLGRDMGDMDMEMVYTRLWVRRYV